MLFGRSPSKEYHCELYSRGVGAAVATITILSSVAVPLPAWGDGGCMPGDVAGQVPRNTRPGDNVCVPRYVAGTVQRENTAAAQGQGYNPQGAYGPKTCVAGLVWREGYDGDAVCVAPTRRTETWQENANAGVGNTGGLRPQGNPPGTSGRPVGTGGRDAALLSAVNDARLHPDKYPPNGNSQGATMTACLRPFNDSGALDNTASTHNNYLATQPGSVVNAFPNMHRNPPPDGVISWAPSTDPPVNIQSCA